MAETKQKQGEKVLEYIARYGSIDTVQAITELHILRLAAVIHELGEMGFVFKRDWKYKFDERGKVVSKIMEYWL